jgi:hypothetical protein
MLGAVSDNFFPSASRGIVCLGDPTSGAVVTLSVPSVKALQNVARLGWPALGWLA